MDGVQLRAELERNHRESYRWALCCCARDSTEAEEVLQSVYLKVLDGKARYGGRTTFKTWLFAVIRLTAAEERRQRLLHRVLLLKYRPPVTPVERPDEIVSRSQQDALFQEALEALPRRQRQALQLVFYHGMSLSEAAQTMGVSLGSARTHYERGKKAVPIRLEQHRRFDEPRSAGREI